MQLYPVPSQNGHLNIFYFRLPKLATRANDILEIPAGWGDLLTLYCEYNAKRRDRDSTWSEAKQLYEETLSSLIGATREYHDQTSTIIMSGGGMYDDWDY